MRYMQILTSLSILIYLFNHFGASGAQLVRFPLIRAIQNKTASGDSIDIQNTQDLSYTGIIQIGSERKNFSVILDTGSSVLWIPDSSMTGQFPNTFDCARSNTCQADPNDPIYLAYGTGEIEGYAASDQVNIGGILVNQFNMVLATDVGDLPSGGNFEGILGLGLRSDDSDDLSGFSTVLDVLTANRLISVGAFSMYLGSDPRSEGESTGEIIFGGYDPKYAASEFQFVSILNRPEVPYWVTSMVAMGYGSNVNISDITNFAVIFDSGTSLIQVSQTFLRNLIDAAGEQGVSFGWNDESQAYECDCSNRNTLENLTFYFSNATFNISPSSYILNSPSGSCYLAIQAQDGEIKLENPIILGDVFLKNYYALFTADNYTVGLADAISGTVFDAAPYLVPGGEPPIGSPRSPSNPLPDEPTNTVPTIWIIIGSLALIIVIVAVYVYFWNRRRKRIADQNSIGNAFVQDSPVQDMQNLEAPRVV